MSFSSMVQEMKGEIGAISRRGLLRSRPRGTGCVQRAEPDDSAMRESSWAQVPPELLRVVLAKVEVGEARWPGRAAVVACAGVCRGWRRVVKEIVPMPEASGKLTFPISLNFSSSLAQGMPLLNVSLGGTGLHSHIFCALGSLTH